MKRLLFILLFFGTLAAKAQNIPARPNPPRLVNDFSHIMTADQVDALERKLVSYDDSTSTQIVVVTVPTLGDYDPHEYALKILRDWGVGNKKTNNGIVILVSTSGNQNERHIRIETGYGMEGAIPDITAQQIIDNAIVPNFREGNFYRGFDQGTDAIIKAAAGEYKAPETRTRRSSGGGGIGSIIFIILLIIIISRIGGGGRGGGGMMSRRGYNPFWGGFLGGMIGSEIGRGGGGGGGGWSGGDGGGGGGGFGGFGGGSGGGGGASGSW